MYPKVKRKLRSSSNGGEPSSSSSSTTGGRLTSDKSAGRGRKSQKPKKIFWAFVEKEDQDNNEIATETTTAAIESNTGRPTRTSTRKLFVDMGTTKNMRRRTRLDGSSHREASLHDRTTENNNDNVTGGSGDNKSPDGLEGDNGTTVKEEPRDDDEISNLCGDSEYSWDEDQTDDSVQSASEEERDVEWTPASFVCQTQMKRQASSKVKDESPMQGLRRTRGRMNAASKRKMSAGGSSAEKKQKQMKCIDCNEKHAHGDCPLTRPVAIVLDTTVTDVHYSLAVGTLPKILKFSTVDENHGPSVFAVENIVRHTQFGPLIGERIKESDIREDMNLKDIWEVFGNSVKLYFETSNENTSNWLRYMRPAASKSEFNVSIIAKDDDLYFVTTMDVNAGTELIYWVEDSTWSWPKIQPLKMICGACNKRFSNPLYFRMHCVIFHDPNCGFGRRKFRCKVCGVAVLGRDALRQHASDAHDGKGAYQCEFCKKFYLRLHSLEAHRTYSCKLNPRRCRPLCEFCGKEFSFPQKLKVHMRRMHSNNSEILKEFECQSCSKLMSSRACLQRHMNEVHAMNEVATCDRCGKTFQNKSNLKIHMLTHSGVKPFQCSENECTAAFTTKQCLQFHYKRVHGYTPENMPPIERCVAYTFENYSGGVSDHGDETMAV